MQPAKTSPLATGDLIEARVAQVWFWEGYFVRSGIDLQTQYGAESIQVTDLDLLAYSFGPNLETRKLIGESKSGEGKSSRKPLDRVVWLRGLRSLVEADAAELTIKAAPTTKIRELGRHLGVSVQSIADLEAREKAADVAQVVDVGTYGPQAISLRIEARRATQGDPLLQAAYRFLRSTVWFLDPYAAAKQTLGLLEKLGTRWIEKVEDDEKRTVRWLTAEAVSVLAFNIAVIAGHMSPMSPKVFTSHVNDRLADGVVPASKMRLLAKDIDKYIGGLLATANAPATLRATALGAFEPQPPDFADSMAELAMRFSASQDGPELVRKVETLVHERIVRRREPSQIVAERLELPQTEAHAAIGAFAAFLRNYAQIPPEVSSALIELVKTRPPSAGQVPTGSQLPLKIGAPLEPLDAASAVQTRKPTAQGSEDASAVRESLFELPESPND